VTGRYASTPQASPDQKQRNNLYIVVIIYQSVTVIFKVRMYVYFTYTIINKGD